MGIGATVASAPLVSTEVLTSVVWFGWFVVDVVSIIAEVIVVIGAITINKLFAAITPTVAAKHPSKHNIY